MVVESSSEEDQSSWEIQRMGAFEFQAVANNKDFYIFHKSILYIIVNITSYYMYIGKFSCTRPYQFVYSQFTLQ